MRQSILVFSLLLCSSSFADRVVHWTQSFYQSEFVGGGQSRRVICTITNPQANDQTVTVSYIDGSGTSLGTGTFTGTLVSLTSQVLSQNEIYQFHFQQNATTITGGIDAFPAYIRVTVTEDEGWLTGGCQVSFSSGDRSFASQIKFMSGLPF